MKKIYVSMLALSLMIAPAFSKVVYEADAGQWTLKGYWNYDINEPGSCVISTFWHNGAQININVFPKTDLSTNVTLTIKHPAYSYTAQGSNKIRKTKSIARFEKVSGGREIDVPFYWQWYPANNNQTIIARNVPDAFIANFLKMDGVTFFPGHDDELKVGLSGTSTVGGLMEECALMVTGQYENE